MINVYVQGNLNVPLAAFILTNEGAIFWQQFDCDPFYYWESQINELSEVAFTILQIPCSKIAIEWLLGGLSFMYDPYSNRMDDDLIDSELMIRMSSIF